MKGGATIAARPLLAGLVDDVLVLLRVELFAGARVILFHGPIALAAGRTGMPLGIDAHLRGRCKLALAGVLLLRIMLTPLQHRGAIAIVRHPVFHRTLVVRIVRDGRLEHALCHPSDDGHYEQQADQAKASHA